MPKPVFTILSTAIVPAERIPPLPDSVKLEQVAFIDILPRQDESLKKQIQILGERKETVVFTSAHAVQRVTTLLTQKPTWTIYCIGQETAGALGQWFGKIQKLHKAENAQALSAKMISDHVRDAIFFCGDQRLDILPDGLRQQGVRLQELVVYETKLTPVRVEYVPDAILFFSPTAVKSYFSLNTLTSATRIFALGTTTASTLKKYISLPVILSPQADKSLVIKMALEYAGLHPIT